MKKIYCPNNSSSGIMNGSSGGNAATTPDDLLQMFQSITTTDHESLIEQFAKVLQCDVPMATFFLESSNWNVETALNLCLSNLGGMPRTLNSAVQPEGAFVTDLSAMTSYQFKPNEVVPMVWSIKNTGAQAWPEGVQLKLTDGTRYEGTNEIERMTVPAVPAGGQVDLQVQVVTPACAGSYAAQWRLSTALGYFADPIWIICNVSDPDGTPGGDSNNNNSGESSMDM